MIFRFLSGVLSVAAWTGAVRSDGMSWEWEQTGVQVKNSMWHVYPGSSGHQCSALVIDQDKDRFGLIGRNCSSQQTGVICEI